jgi:hypothetical protein
MAQHQHHTPTDADVLEAATVITRSALRLVSSITRYLADQEAGPAELGAAIAVALRNFDQVAAAAVGRVSVPTLELDSERVFGVVSGFYRQCDQAPSEAPERSARVTEALQDAAGVLRAKAH